MKIRTYYTKQNPYVDKVTFESVKIWVLNYLDSTLNKKWPFWAKLRSYLNYIKSIILKVSLTACDLQ